MNDVTKLPKWAQREIERLNRNVDYWKEKARQVSEGDSDTYIEDMTDRVYLPSGTKVTFAPGNGRFGVEVGVRPEGVFVYGAHASRFLIVPLSGNMVMLQEFDR